MTWHQADLQSSSAPPAQEEEEEEEDLPDFGPLTPAARQFVQIPIGDFQKSYAFIQKDSSVLSETTHDSLRRREKGRKGFSTAMCPSVFVGELLSTIGSRWSWVVLPKVGPSSRVQRCGISTQQSLD
jgi:hypothetical protein